MRIFESGATRDDDGHKLDYDGFLSPDVLERYAIYMQKCRVQTDGKLRSSDNWKKGITQQAYIKSMWRHFMSVWKAHHYGDVAEDDLCALMFNTMGYLFEELREKRAMSKNEFTEAVQLELPFEDPIQC